MAILREKQDVHEKWSELERKFEKLQHDFSVKEAQNHALQVGHFAIFKDRYIFLK